MVPDKWEWKQFLLVSKHSSIYVLKLNTGNDVTEAMYLVDFVKEKFNFTGSDRIYRKDVKENEN